MWVNFFVTYVLNSYTGKRAVIKPAYRRQAPFDKLRITFTMNAVTIRDYCRL
jgi:hypothetical protein